jgi:flagellar basal body-associated protein FliL
MSKKITMSTKPNRNNTQELNADAWVNQGAALTTNGHEPEKEKTARFTIDIPVSLHARIKSQCALKRVKMREEVLAMLEEKFPVN